MSRSANRGGAGGSRVRARDPSAGPVAEITPAIIPLEGEVCRAHRRARLPARIPARQLRLRLSTTSGLHLNRGVTAARAASTIAAGAADAIAALGRQGGGGGRDRGPRRDLPPSKYASPRPFEPKPFESKPREFEPAEALPADFEPIILPGESLAKYKNRAPVAPAAARPEAARSRSSRGANRTADSFGGTGSRAIFLWLAECSLCHSVSGNF